MTSGQSSTERQEALWRRFHQGSELESTLKLSRFKVESLQVHKFMTRSSKLS